MGKQPIFSGATPLIRKQERAEYRLAQSLRRQQRLSNLIPIPQLNNSLKRPQPEQETPPLPIVPTPAKDRGPRLNRPKRIKPPITSPPVEPTISIVNATTRAHALPFAPLINPRTTTDGTTTTTGAGILPCWLDPIYAFGILFANFNNAPSDNSSIPINTTPIDTIGVRVTPGETEVVMKKKKRKLNPKRVTEVVVPVTLTRQAPAPVPVPTSLLPPLSPPPQSSSSLLPIVINVGPSTSKDKTIKIAEKLARLERKTLKRLERRGRKNLGGKSIVEMEIELEREREGEGDEDEEVQMEVDQQDEQQEEEEVEINQLASQSQSQSQTFSKKSPYIPPSHITQVLPPTPCHDEASNMEEDEQDETDHQILTPSRTFQPPPANSVSTELGSNPQFQPQPTANLYQSQLAIPTSSSSVTSTPLSSSSEEEEERELLPPPSAQTKRIDQVVPESRIEIPEPRLFIFPPPPPPPLVSTTSSSIPIYKLTTIGNDLNSSSSNDSSSSSSSEEEEGGKGEGNSQASKKIKSRRSIGRIANEAFGSHPPFSQNRRPPSSSLPFPTSPDLGASSGSFLGMEEEELERLQRLGRGGVERALREAEWVRDSSEEGSERSVLELELDGELDGERERERRTPRFGGRKRSSSSAGEEGSGDEKLGVRMAGLEKTLEGEREVKNLVQHENEEEQEEEEEERLPVVLVQEVLPLVPLEQEEEQDEIQSTAVLSDPTSEPPDTEDDPILPSSPTISVSKGLPLFNPPSPVLSQEIERLQDSHSRPQGGLGPFSVLMPRLEISIEPPTPDIAPVESFGTLNSTLPPPPAATTTTEALETAETPEESIMIPQFVPPPPTSPRKSTRQSVRKNTPIPNPFSPESIETPTTSFSPKKSKVEKSTPLRGPWDTGLNPDFINGTPPLPPASSLSTQKVKKGNQIPATPRTRASTMLGLEALSQHASTLRRSTRGVNVSSTLEHQGNQNGVKITTGGKKAWLLDPGASDDEEAEEEGDTKGEKGTSTIRRKSGKSLWI